MKKTISILSLVAVLLSCGSNETKTTSADNKTADPSANPDYKKGFDLVAKSDCFTCHKVSDASTGPAYTEVAKRYAGKSGAEDSLAHKILAGGGGNWGNIPMKSHPELSNDEAKAMVKYILTLNNP